MNDFLLRFARSRESNEVLEFNRFGKALRKLAAHQDGQDLVECALVIALIALAATAGMNVLASDISAAFTSVGKRINADVQLGPLTRLIGSGHCKTEGAGKMTEASPCHALTSSGFPFCLLMEKSHAC